MHKRWVRYTVGAFLVILLGVALLAVSLYWYLEPSRYFSRVEHPVLGVPQQQKSGEPNTTNPDDHQQSKEARLTDPVQHKPEPSFNVLILGVDEAEGGISRTDVIMLAHVNPLTKGVELLSIPRDTKVKIDGVGYTKINHAHVVGSLHGGNHSGTTATIQSVINLLDLPVNYYVKVSFQGFEHLVDSIGGIDVNLPQRIGAFPSGINHLNGGQALDAARERYSLPRGDMDRQVNQSLVLKAIVTKVLQADNIPKIPTLYQTVKTDLIDTNFTDTDLISLSLLFQGITDEEIHYVQLPGKGVFGMDPLVKAQLYYWEPDTGAMKSIAQSFQNQHN